MHKALVEASWVQKRRRCGAQATTGNALLARRLTRGESLRIPRRYVYIDFGVISSLSTSFERRAVASASILDTGRVACRHDIFGSKDRLKALSAVRATAMKPWLQLHDASRYEP